MGHRSILHCWEGIYMRDPLVHWHDVVRWMLCLTRCINDIHKCKGYSWWAPFYYPIDQYKIVMSRWAPHCLESVFTLEDLSHLKSKCLRSECLSCLKKAEGLDKNAYTASGLDNRSISFLLSRQMVNQREVNNIFLTRIQVE